MELRAAGAERYMRQAFDQIVAVIRAVGEPGINERPPGPDTNSISALATHCCGVTEYWLGHVGLGRMTTRDRAAEFVAIATIADLEALIDRTVARAAADVAHLDAGRGTTESKRSSAATVGRSDAELVLHVLEELYQHLGHMELTADVLAS